jgi:hypothetical protein
LSFGPARHRPKVERDMLALGMRAMVRAWVTKAGMDRYDCAFFGGATVADAVDHYTKTIRKAVRVSVGRADVIDLLTGEARVVEIGGRTP